MTEMCFFLPTLEVAKVKGGTPQRNSEYTLVLRTKQCSSYFEIPLSLHILIFLKYLFGDLMTEGFFFPRVSLFPELDMK